jgi:hypothetical protein
MLIIDIIEKRRKIISILSQRFTMRKLSGISRDKRR